LQSRKSPSNAQNANLQNPYGKIFCTACQTALGAAGALIQEQEPVAMERSKTLELLAENPKVMELLRKLAENPQMLSRIA